MIGDKILVTPAHRQAAVALTKYLGFTKHRPIHKLALSICGESGSGKSEMAIAFRDELVKLEIPSVIFQQDDYFKYPPFTNAKKREMDINQVGPQEVDLNRLDNDIAKFKTGAKIIEKPLVHYDENRFSTEQLIVKEAVVAIVEGTYTCQLHSLDYRVFINRTYTETRKHRLKRAREEQNDFLEQILLIEHQIIRRYKTRANFVIEKDFSVRSQP